MKWKKLSYWNGHIIFLVVASLLDTSHMLFEDTWKSNSQFRKWPKKKIFHFNLQWIVLHEKKKKLTQHYKKLEKPYSNASLKEKSPKNVVSSDKSSKNDGMQERLERNKAFFSIRSWNKSTRIAGIRSKGVIIMNDFMIDAFQWITAMACKLALQLSIDEKTIRMS